MPSVLQQHIDRRIDQVSRFLRKKYPEYSADHISTRISERAQVKAG